MWVAGLAVALLGTIGAWGDDEQEIPFAQCPAAVQKTLQLEAKGAKIDAVTKTLEGDSATYQATVAIGGKPYSITVDGEGTLTELSLEPDEDEVKFAKCPPAVQATFRHESKDTKIETVEKDIKYGTLVFETVVEVGGKDYLIVVAQDGTLVEKSLVVEEEDIEFTACPTAVQKALREHAQGGKIGDVTRTTAAIGHVFEADVEVGGKSYSIEVSEHGTLISKTLNDDDE
jgi:hypothetical protein